jgi:pyruvate dehydrogenase E1 component alpha subunit
MPVSQEKLRWMYETMYRIRRFEERLLEETLKGNAMGVAHTSDGEEAGPTGICAHLGDDDWISSTHRGHGHCIAKGLDLKGMYAEIFGRVDGLCRGKGGSMHIADFTKGMLGANAIVGAGIPLAVGAAFTAKYKNTGGVGVAFFGDGATNQGVFHESINLASVFKLPVIFACENNHYAQSTSVEYAVPVKDIADRAAGYAIPGIVVDGMDVLAVYEAAGEAIARARAGEGPTLLEMKTYRFHGHFHADNPRTYRLEDEETEWKKRDPLVTFESKVTEQDLMDASELEQIRDAIEAEVNEAVEFGLSSPLPTADELYDNVYVSYPNSLAGLH